jgi:hypothetical protein
MLVSQRSGSGRSRVTSGRRRQISEFWRIRLPGIRCIVCGDNDDGAFETPRAGTACKALSS